MENKEYDPNFPAGGPTPDHLTIILKNGRHTVLLSVTPGTSATEIAQLLLLALQARNIKSIANVPVPSSDRDDLVEFGIPLDAKDLEKGFELFDRDEIDSGENETTARGSRKRKATSERPVEMEGLADGKVMAFRFKTGSEMELDDDNKGTVADPGWNVELPSADEDA